MKLEIKKIEFSQETKENIKNTDWNTHIYNFKEGLDTCNNSKTLLRALLAFTNIIVEKSQQENLDISSLIKIENENN